MTRERAALTSRFAGPEESPGFLLWQVTNAWQRAQRDALRPLGLTHVQFVLLASASWRAVGDGPLTQRALAEHARTDAMMTSQVIRVLAKRGLVERVRDANDARAWRIAPTRAGLTLAERAIAVVEVADLAFFSTLGAARRDFTRALARLAAAHR